MADDPKPGTGDNSKPADQNVPTSPNNPNQNPDLVVDKPSCEPAAPKVPGQTPVVDPGDARPLPLTDEEVERRMRAAARQAVTDERQRAHEIRTLALRAKLPEFGAEHVELGTELGRFRNLLTDRLLEERENDGGPKGSAAVAERSLNEGRNNDRATNQARFRRVLGKPEKRA